MIETFCILSLMVWIGVFICEAFKGTGKASSSPSVRCVKTSRTAEKNRQASFRIRPQKAEKGEEETSGICKMEKDESGEMEQVQTIPQRFRLEIR